VGVGVRCCACALVLLCSLLRAREPSRCSISPLANLAQLASLSSGLLADASCGFPTHSAHSSPLPHERTYATRASERFTPRPRRTARPRRHAAHGTHTHSRATHARIHTRTPTHTHTRTHHHT
jgi:hypothetical protein